MASKDETISKIYHEFYGSINNTYADAKKIDKTITLKDVKNWFDKSFVRQKNLKGYNSYIAQHPHEEYQMDLFFINDLEDQEYKIGLMMIDIFSKYMTVVPLESKQTAELLKGIKEAFQNMGKKPEVIYTDDEGALNSKEIQKYFRDEHIKHIVSRGHAPVAERAIRTFKALMYKLVENNELGQWIVVIPKALTLYNYKMVSRATSMTPNEARQDKNVLDAKLHMEIHKVRKRKYPEIGVGDSVRFYKKKDKFDKERVPVWSKTIHKVEKIEHDHNQAFYYISGVEKPFMRHEILKINS
jgi:hypothetical protein